MSAESKNYSPLPRKITERILDIWDFYKETVGLEWDFVYKLRTDEDKKYSDEEIKQELLDRGEDRAEMVELYKEYKKEKRATTETTNN